MKLNITVDVQEIFDEQNEQAFRDGEQSYEGSCGGEGYSLKETIKNEIIKGLKSSISSDCLKSVEVKSKSAIESVISESVNKAKETIESRALEFTNEWLDKKTVISDKWGDPVNELTISELIKQSFDSLLERKVTRDGKFSDGYGSDMKLINYLTGEKVKQEVESRLGDFKRDIDKQIKAYIESGIKESVASKFAEMVIQTANSQHKQLSKN